MTEKGGEKRPRRDSGRTRLCKLARLAHSNRGKDAFSRRVGRLQETSYDGS